MKPLVAVFLFFAYAHPVSPQVLSNPTPLQNQIVLETFNAMPLSFTENAGQVHSEVKFTTRGSGASLFFSEKGVTFLLSRETDDSKQRRLSGRSRREMRRGYHNPKIEREYHVLELQFEGCNPHPEIVGEDRLPWNNNYFIGRNRSQWRTDVPNYQKVRFKQIYNGIDLVYYGDKYTLKYDFVVSKIGNPSTIRLTYKGILGMSVNEKGELEVETSVGVFKERVPVAYQEIDGKKIFIEVSYCLLDETCFTFDLGVYNPEFDLILDPELAYVKEFGEGDADFTGDILVDEDKNIYITGRTNSITAYGTLNTFHNVEDSARYDVFVMKLKGHNGKPLFSTYIGGALDDCGYGIDIDSQGYIYITGEAAAYSWMDTGFPVTENAYLDYLENIGVFVLKLNSQGSELIYSTLIGPGEGHDIQVDNSGNAIITGFTWAHNSTYYPVTPNAYFAPHGRVVVSKLNNNGTDLIFSSILGGEWGRALEIATNGDILVGGTSLGSDVASGNVFDRTFNGSDDAFISRLRYDGSELVFATFFGGRNADYCEGLVLDNSDYIYVTGHTESTDLPVTAGAYDVTLDQDYSAFVTKFDPMGKTLLYSTLIENRELEVLGEMAMDIDLDDFGRAYITGYSYIKDSSPGAYEYAHLYVLNETGSDCIDCQYIEQHKGQTVAVYNSTDVFIAGGNLYPYSNAGTVFVARFTGYVPKPASIEIRYPNSPDVKWSMGETVAIQWRAYGDVGDLVKIELLRNEELQRIITPDTPNDGYKTWTVSSRLTVGAGYQVKISSVSNPGVHQLSHAFMISGTPDNQGKTYLAPGIADYNVPVLDGKLDDSIWDFVDSDSLLKGGEPGAYDSTIVAFDDYLATFRAVWCDETNKLYVGVEVQDDIRGSLDNGPTSSYYLPYHDDSIEFFTDGDYSGGDYWGLYGPAQAWRVTVENVRDLYNYPDPSYNHSVYTGNGFNSAVSQGVDGNWTCEAVFTIYNECPTDIRDLTEGDVIGWEVRYNDSDDEIHNGTYYAMDHQIGWNYAGKAWRDADEFGALALGKMMEIPVIEVTYPEGEGIWFERNKLQEIQWRVLGNVGSLVQIDLYKGETFSYTLADTTLNDSLFMWMIPADIELSTDYNVKIISHINSNVYAFSDLFEIVEYRRLSLTHPDTANIQYKPGDNLPVIWTSSGDVGNEIRLELYKYNELSITITDNTENDGAYIWLMPVEMDTSTGYRVKISALSDEYIFDWSNNPFTIIEDTGIDSENPVPKTNRLLGAYPNPFNPKTTIRYQITETSNVQITIYNILGEKVRTLLNKNKNAGLHEVQWQGSNEQGQQVASGIFIVGMKAGAFTQRQKVMLIR